MKRIRVAVVLALLCAVGPAAQQAPAPPPPAQEPPPVTFRLEVNYVELDAIVTDAQGNPATNLTAGDFEVLEDGRPQQITAFSLVDLPVERLERPLFAPAPIEPDVQTNTSAEGRIYLVVLDDLHTTFTNTIRVKRALRDFFERSFGVNDRAAVVYTSGRGSDAQDFTNNRRLLLASVDRFVGRAQPSEVLGVNDPLNRDPSLLGAGDPVEVEQAFNARTAMSSIRRLAEFMGGVRGRRKAMILVSEGISYDIFDVINKRSASVVMQETSDAVAAATRSNVAIYPVDPRGLSGFDEAIELGGLPADDRTFVAVRGVLDTQRLQQESLRVLATETGGFATVNRNDFDGAFARIVRENSSYYLLGYYSTNERRDGRFRRLEVRVRRPGLQVRSRRGYTAPRGRAPEGRGAAGTNPVVAAAGEALGSPIPIAGIPMRVFAAAYKGSAPNSAVVLAIEVEGAMFRFVEKGGVLTDRLEVTFTAVNSRGDLRGGDRHSVAMAMKPDTAARVRDRGFLIVSQTELPPGRYQMRVAAAEEGANLSGSVLYDLEVPDFYKPGFSMSGLSMTSALESAGTPTALAKNPLGDFLPGPPTTAREFARDDELALFAEFYENTRGAPPHQLDLSTTVRAEGGTVVFEDTETRSSADLQGGSGGHGYAIRVPLRDFAPGAYVLRVEGRSRITPDAVAGREILIRVR